MRVQRHALTVLICAQGGTGWVVEKHCWGVGVGSSSTSGHVWTVPLQNRHCDFVWGETIHHKTCEPNLSATWRREPRLRCCSCLRAGLLFITEFHFLMQTDWEMLCPPCLAEKNPKLHQQLFVDSFTSHKKRYKRYFFTKNIGGVFCSTCSYKKTRFRCPEELKWKKLMAGVGINRFETRIKSRKY